MIQPLDEFRRDARAWLEANAERRAPTGEFRWGEGSDHVAVFHNLTIEEEGEFIARSRVWQQKKSDAGYGSISWPAEYGGGGLPREYENAFHRLEWEYETPPIHEAVGISLNIEAPTILTVGNEDQKKRYVEALRRTDSLCCQLFSEPEAGSDVGAIACRAVRDGDEWVITGQKVWTSGAIHADLGYLIARTDPTAPRQTGMTAFIVDMKAPGVEVRPLRQMSGGSSFNEVFFTEARIPDADRLGEVGTGWATAMTTLGFERATVSGGAGGGSGDTVVRLAAMARQFGKANDAVIRQEIAQVFIESRVRAWTGARAVAAAKSGVPGPEGSIGKLATTNGMQRISALVSSILGPRLVADTGEWGTYAWSEYVNGVPGLRVAGGTDEIQRNTVSERALGMPREPR